MRRRLATVAILFLMLVGTPVGSAPRGEPLTLCVVVDVTASMAPLGVQLGQGSAAVRVSKDEVASQTVAAVSGLSDLLEPGDRACVGRIARTIAFSSGFVAPGAFGDALRVLEASEAERLGPSPVWDAADDALRRLEGEGGRRAVLLWTDGRASGNRLSRHDVARRARALAIPIHVVSPPTENLIRQSETVAVRVRPSVFLEWLARETGGEFRTARRSMAWPLGDVLAPFGEFIEIVRRGASPIH